MNKTGRKRGLIWRLIRELARHKSHFTVDNFTPALSRPQARENCRRLVEAGELRIVQPGSKGRNGRAAVYARAAKLQIKADKIC